MTRPASIVLLRCGLAHAVLLQFALTLSGASLAAEFRPGRTEELLANPHVGFMLWGTTTGASNHYGASIRHVYVPWREIETSDQVFDWDGFEQRRLQPFLTANPDTTFVLRLVADYPNGAASGLTTYYSGGQNQRDYPLFLEQPPLNIPGVDYASCNGDGPGRTPDWNHPRMAAQMAELVAAMAARYDGHPRITAIQVGLLGLWGEWHQSGCPQNAPGAAVKASVRDAYAAAFGQTPLQTRYARNPDAVGVEFGFHEDYFPSFTALCSRFVPAFPRCSSTGDWNLEWAMLNVTPASQDNWRSAPLSGESPFSDQKNTWTERTADVVSLLRSFHFSFLGPAGKHQEPGHAGAMSQIRANLGYRLHLDRVVLPDALVPGEPFSLTLELGNGGTAPLYHRYLLAIDGVDSGGVVRFSLLSGADLRDVLPDQALLVEEDHVLPQGTPAGGYALRARLLPMVPGSTPVTLHSSPRDAAGRVILGAIDVGLAPTDLIFADGFGN
ncbi:MAG: DUF4832 domain-containing protein [Xanthomonadales bacterium]|nr:DUF4832 domain-containing protein [Xanthomonadales bacterium]